MGLASFVNLDPKWCVTVNSIVYVSSLITKMLNLCVHSYQIIDTTNLMKLCCFFVLLKIILVWKLCVVEDHTCMFPLYTECPDRTKLSAIPKTIFESNDFDFGSTISYKQWVSAGETTLVTFESTVNEFIDIFIDKIFELFHHHFMNVQQAAYLKKIKAMLDNACIILMDFAGNYSFLVQDAIQGFYWQNRQSTLHPFAMYHNDDDGKLKCHCYCVISDHLLLDQTAVHCCISLVIPTICTRNPRINN